MGHVVDVQVECSDPMFWNYVCSDGRMMGQRISPRWTSPAMMIHSHEVEMMLTKGRRAELVEGSGICSFSTRGHGTGFLRTYFSDASRACPAAEVFLYEWFTDGEEMLERTVLKDGRVVGHYFVTPDSNFELYAGAIDLIFGVEVNPPGD